MDQQRMRLTTVRSGESSSGLGRRDFLKYAALLAGGVASLPLGGLVHAQERGASRLLSLSAPRTIPRPVPLLDQQAGGELLERLRRNMGRLESERYDPDHLFQTTDSGDPWPGDTEGRWILGVTLEAQALQREPKYLSEVFRRLPGKLNARGLFGAERPANVFDEQLLSSHGWVLRGLSEYHAWTGNSDALARANRILDSLAVPLGGKNIASYPLAPAERSHNGSESGHLSQEIGGWRVSSDTGCIFIFFDGLVQAVDLLGRDDLLPVVDELKNLMLRADLAALKAQTHASLTGLRALCRIYERDRSATLLRALRDRWSLYRNNAMTANDENFNWFGRPEWTEPCAVVDSLLVAVNLWRFTRDPSYLEDAHKIYYNGLAAEQRANGGFGLNSCAHMDEPVLKMHTLEATWCCTMRGGEGLARAAQFSLFTDDDGVMVTFPREGVATLTQGSESITLRQTTKYPQGDWAKLEVVEVSPGFTGKLKLFSPGWMSNSRLKLNDREIIAPVSEGFLVLSQRLRKGDRVDWQFQQPLRANETQECVSVYRGPLLLGVKGGGLPKPFDGAALPDFGASEPVVLGGEKFTSVYHLMDPAAEQKEYGCQVLFRNRGKSVSS